ncbi:hypothetical protein J6590_076317 [Homalodisca vitripennis]|nr:hypothetical protein J6590_076317 [Homalodisca vitripennis]
MNEPKATRDRLSDEPSRAYGPIPRLSSGCARTAQRGGTGAGREFQYCEPRRRRMRGKLRDLLTCTFSSEPRPTLHRSRSSGTLITHIHGTKFRGTQESAASQIVVRRKSGPIINRGIYDKARLVTSPHPITHPRGWWVVDDVIDTHRAGPLITTRYQYCTRSLRPRCVVTPCNVSNFNTSLEVQCSLSVCDTTSCVLVDINNVSDH